MDTLNISKQIESNLTKTSIQLLQKELKERLEKIDYNKIVEIICQKINSLIIELEMRDLIRVKQLQNSDKLSISKIMLLHTEDQILTQNFYQKFFEIQNLINLYLKRQILITQVLKDENNNRVIYISDNTAEYLIRDERYNKLIYSLDPHGQKLQSIMQDKSLKILQAVANEVEKRYDDHLLKEVKGHLVMWYFNKQWLMYRFFTKGPINEAFVNFYVHGKELEGANGESKIDDFIRNEYFGAIKADSAPGFILGDVTVNNLQLAVKGQYGSPQGIIKILKEWYVLMRENQGTFTKNSLDKFIIDYQQRTSTEPQISQYTKYFSEQALEEIGVTDFDDYLESLYE